MSTKKGMAKTDAQKGTKTSTSTETSKSNPAVSGPQPLSHPEQPSPQKKVLILLNNDLPDWDNVAVLLLFAKVAQHLEQKFGKHAVEKLFLLELHRVNLGIHRLQGSSISTFLKPMFKVLFGEKGPDEEKGLVQKYRMRFSPQVNKDLDRVLERRRISGGGASTFMRADLSNELVNAIISHDNLIEELIRNLKKDGNFKPNKKFHEPCSCREGQARRCDSCKLRFGLIRDQLMTCVRSVDPKDWAGSLLAAKLYAQDYLKVLMEHELLENDDRFYLDQGGLPGLTAPLEARAEHPGHLVNNPALVEYYQLQMNSVRSDEERRANMRNYMKKMLDPSCEKKIDTSTINGKDRYSTIIRKGKQAQKIFFFGGSSMTLLKQLISSGLKDKIEFVGQGVSTTPSTFPGISYFACHLLTTHEQGVNKALSLNLTGNSFNWDLNPSAAYSVLCRQGDATDKIPEFMLGSTELGKRRLFQGQNLASIFAGRRNDRFGRRIVAFGVPAAKGDLENFILEAKKIDDFETTRKNSTPEKVKLPQDPRKEKEVAEAQNKYNDYLTRRVQGADLAAFLAAYSKTFRTDHCITYKPEYMFIARKKDKDGKELQAVERVRFDSHAGKNEGEICMPLNESVTLFMPGPTGKEETEITVKLTNKMINEVKHAMEEKVAAALGLLPSAVPTAAAQIRPANGEAKSGTTTTNDKPQAQKPRSLPTPTGGHNADAAGGKKQSVAPDPEITRNTTPPVLNHNLDSRPRSREGGQANMPASAGAPGRTGVLPTGHNRPTNKGASGRTQGRGSEQPGGGTHPTEPQPRPRLHSPVQSRK
jgi:hypothetical protein